MASMYNKHNNTETTDCVALSGAARQAQSPSVSGDLTKSRKAKSLALGHSLTSSAIASPSVSIESKKTPSTSQVNLTESSTRNSPSGKKSGSEPNSKSALGRSLTSSSVVSPVVSFNSKKAPSTHKVNLNESSTRSADNEGFVKVGKTNNTKSKSQPIRRVPTDTDVARVITLDNSNENTQVLVCREWIKFCAASPADKCKFKCAHKPNSPQQPHLPKPICQAFLTSGCAKGDTCAYPHPIELAPVLCVPVTTASATSAGASVAVPTKTVRKFTAMCGTHMLNEINPKNPACKFGSRCFFAHNQAKVVSYDFITRLDNAMKSSGKIDIQGIFNEVYRVLSENWHLVQHMYLLSHKPCPSLPEPVPTNFGDMMNIWFVAAGRARKENHPVNFGLFSGPDSEEENMAWAIGRRVYLCKQDVDCEVQRLIGGDNCRVKAEDLCTHAGNCKRGVHASCIGSNGLLPILCIADLCGNCNCTIKSGMQALEERNQLENQLRVMQTSRLELVASKARLCTTKTAEIDKKLSQVNRAIETVAHQIVNTFRKIHLVSDLKYAPLVEVQLNETAPVDLAQVVFEELPTMTPEEIAIVRAKMEESSRINAIVARENERRRKAEHMMVSYIKSFKFLKMTRSLDNTDPFHRAYIITGAYKHMELQAFIADTKGNQVFAHWYSKSLGMSFARFSKDISSKTAIWDSMGIESKVIENRSWDSASKSTIVEVVDVEEYHVPSDKDLYRNFWSWYYGIPLFADPAVVGTARKVARDSPLLFEQYKSTYPTFSISFSEWINKDPTLSRAIVLVQSDNVCIEDALRYISNNIEESGLSVSEFSRYNFKTVMDWIKVNSCLVALNQTITTVESYIADIDRYNQYYLAGWWMHYDNHGGFDKFMADKAAGWTHTESGIKCTAADNAKAIAAEEKRIKKAQKDLELMSMINSICSSGTSQSNIFQNLKKVKKVIVRKDSDSDSEDDEHVVGSDSFKVQDDVFSSKKRVQLAGQMFLPFGKDFYIFRSQQNEERDSGNKSIRKIHIGPFADEKTAKKIMSAMKIFNKANSGRGMVLRIVHNCPMNDRQKESWDVMYGDTCTYKYEQKVCSRGDNPYEWMFELVKEMCNQGPLSEYKVHNFVSNISVISSFFDEPANAKSESGFKFDENSESGDSDSDSDSDDESDDGLEQLVKYTQRTKKVVDSDSDDESEMPVAPKVTSPVAPKVSVTPVAPVAPVVPVTSSVPKKVSAKEEIQARLKAKKDAKIAEELALKAKKEASKILGKKPKSETPVQVQVPAAGKCKPNKSSIKLSGTYDPIREQLEAVY